MTRQRRVAIVTDSTSDIMPEEGARHDIHVVPLNIHFGNDVFRDRIEMSTDEFLRRMEQSSALPTTSQPSVGAFETLFRALAKDHDEIVAPLISSKLSGTVQSASIAAENVHDCDIHIVDSQTSTWGLGLMVQHAKRLADEGMSGAHIAELLHAELDRYHVVFMIETLEHLRRGGRIGKAAQMVGSLLQLKPILRVDNGLIVPFERTRTRKKAIAAILDYASEFDSPEQIKVMWNSTPDDADAMAASLRERLPETAISTGQIGAVLATHCGPDVVGVTVKERNSD